MVINNCINNFNVMYIENTKYSNKNCQKYNSQLCNMLIVMKVNSGVQNPLELSIRITMSLHDRQVRKKRHINNHNCTENTLSYSNGSMYAKVPGMHNSFNCKQ